MMKILLISLCFTIIIWATACYHAADLSVIPPKPVPPGPEFKCSHDTIFFQNSVYPLIYTGCAKSGCHDGSDGDFVLNNYQGIMELVVPFDPLGSDLYTILFSNEEGRMPQDHPFTLDQKSIIYWWIAQGAKDNRCDSIVCDTTNISYSSSVAPIINSWCLNCHSGSNPGGGIHLETYDDVSVVADNGRLMGAIRHQDGFKPMPKDGPMLSPCSIDIINKWIIAGKP